MLSWKEGCEEPILARVSNSTLVIALTPSFETAYAMAPGNFPRLRPEIEEMLITVPFSFALTICLHTYLVTSHKPVRLVAKVAFQSSSGQSSGE